MIPLFSLIIIVIMIIIIIKVIVSVVVVSLKKFREFLPRNDDRWQKNESYQKDLFSVFDQTFSMETIGAAPFSQKPFGRQTFG